MGLFKKRQRTEEELDAMRAEMRSLRQHLQQTDAVKEQLAERLGHLDAENQRLNQQVGSVEARVGEVADQVGSVEHEVVTVAGSIGPTVEHAIRHAASSSPSTDDVEGLRNEVRSLGALTEKIDALDAVIAQQSSAPGPLPDPIMGSETPDVPLADLRQQLEDLAAALQLQQSQIADVALVATDAAERSEQTDAKVAGFGAPDEWAPLDGTERSDDDEARRQLSQLAEKVGALDSRVNQVSLELTNQLTELSTDLDRAGDQTDNSELIDRITAQLDDVTGGQERLANEQARYAIQFRADLAELADRLKRK